MYTIYTISLRCKFFFMKQQKRSLTSPGVNLGSCLPSLGSYIFKITGKKQVNRAIKQPGRLASLFISADLIGENLILQ